MVTAYFAKLMCLIENVKFYGYINYMLVLFLFLMCLVSSRTELM